MPAEGHALVRLIRWCAAAAALGTVHAVINARMLRTAPASPRSPSTEIAVLVPARDEGATIGRCLRALLDQRGMASALPIVVLDDDSSDDTAAVVARIAAAHPSASLRMIRGTPPGPGRLGKPHACAALAAAVPQADVLVFCDADVILAPDAIAATVAVLDKTGLDMVCPYPRQQAGSIAERLVQPLLQWSWLTFLPLRISERSPRPSLGAANGQFLAVRRSAYDAAGGHDAVADQVLEDLALLRALKRSGGSGGVIDGTGLASCRMYTGRASLQAGYAKSLWAGFGSPAGAMTAVAGLSAVYVVPAIAALGGSPAGLLGYLAGAAGRIVTARRTGGRWWPDAFAHPFSILAFDLLVLASWRGRRRGSLRWKGRPV